MTIDEMLADYRVQLGRIDDTRQGEMALARPEVRLVGLWSPAPQSGKTTAVETLIEARFCHGAQDFLAERVSFADPLRKIISAVIYELGDLSDELTPWAYMADGRLKEVPIPGIGKSFVELAIMLGTTVGRDWLGEDCWVKPWRERVQATQANGYLALSDDMRFPNEAAAVRDLGGVLIGIHRPGATVSAQRAAAEGRLSLDMMDAVVTNDCDLVTFRGRVVEAARCLGVRV